MSVTGVRPFFLNCQSRDWPALLSYLEAGEKVERPDWLIDHVMPLSIATICFCRGAKEYLKSRGSLLFAGIDMVLGMAFILLWLL